MRRFALMLCVAVTAIPLSRVDAETIYATGFENPPFQSGQPLVGQDGWVNQIYGGNPLGPNALISTAQPQSGLQSVQVKGSDLTPTDLGYALGSYRRFVDFDVAAAGFPVVRVSADVRLDGPPTEQTSDRATGDFFGANLKGFSGDGGLGEISLSSDGHVYGYTNTDSYLFGMPAALGQYHHLALDLDFTNRTTTFSMDGQVLGTVPFQADFTSNILSRGSFVVYALDPDSLSRDRSAYTANYDNFSIARVPEPSALVLLALGVVGLVVVGMRQRAPRL